MHLKALIGSALLLGMTSPVAAARPGTPERYDLDQSTSRISFVARHSFGKVRGKFNTFSGHIMLDSADITRSTVEVTIEAASLDTDAPERDDHLRSSDFFDVRDFPTITFKSTSMEKSEDGGLTLVGDLTIRDVTRPVRVPFEISEPLSEPGRKRIEADGVFEISRRDYGLKYGGLLEAAQVVRDSIRIQLTVQAATAPATDQ